MAKQTNITYNDNLPIGKFSQIFDVPKALIFHFSHLKIENIVLPLS